MDIRSILLNFGFTSKEATTYLATLELGMAPASVIARKAKMKRTTVHEILQKLSTKGFVEFFRKKNAKYFSVLPPRQLLRKYEDHVESLRSSLPQMLAIENRIVHKPKVSFYEGKEDLRRLYMDILRSSTEILNYFHPEKLFEYFGEEWVRHQVIEERVKRKLPVRVIMPDSPLAKRFLSRAGKELRTARIIRDTSLQIPNEIYLYDNKYSIFSFDDDLAFQIESNDVVTSQRSIFELAWASGKLLS